MVLLTSSVAADVLSPFFTKNGAKSLFSNQIALKKANNYVLLPKKKLTLVDENQEIQEQAKEIYKAFKSDIPEQVQETTEAPKVYDSAEAELIDKYGSPFESADVSAIKDAPKPFQAMIKALHMGEDELAFKYAVQYVRYQRDMDQVNKKAISMIGQGFVREGMLSEESWASSPEHQEYFYLRNIDLGEPEKENDTANYVKKYTNKLNKKAQEIIARSNRAKYELIEDVEQIDSESLEINEEEERRIARAELKGKIPVDPKGQVDVYFFFNPQDKIALGISKDIQKIYELSKENDKLEFLGMTEDFYSETDIKVYKVKTKADFPVLSGSKLAKELQLTNFPSLVFITRNSFNYYKLSEIKSYYYIDELIKIMQGVK